MNLSKSLYRYVKGQGMRAVAVGALGLGMVSLLLAWLGVSGASLTTEQLPYVVSGAVAGLFALGVAATLWLSADLRDEFQRLGEIKRLLADRSPHHEELTLESDAGDGATGHSRSAVSVAQL